LFCLLIVVRAVFDFRFFLARKIEKWREVNL